ncbi:MAG: hypothetical protein JWL85_324 [Candidatus Saccharibacteria bacterium]|nr:hypothetical protein [Candidatus Saccharibacteria bacterium]
MNPNDQPSSNPSADQPSAPPVPESQNQPEDINENTAPVSDAVSSAPETAPVVPGSVVDPSAATSQAPLLGENNVPSETPVAVPILPTPPKRSKKALLAVVIIAVIALLMAASAAAYYAVIVPNQPENVLKAAVHNTLEQRQASSKGTLSIEMLQAKEGEPKNIDVSFNGQGNADASAFAAQVDVAISGVKIPVEVRSVDKNLYFKLGDLGSIKGVLKLTDPQAASMIDAASKVVSNQWVEVDSSLLKQADAECAVDNYSLTKEDVDQLVKTYENHQFARIKSSSEETVNGTASIKYQLEFDEAKANEFGKSVKDISVMKKLEECAKKGGQDKALNQFDTELDKEVKDKGTYEFYLWVDKSKKLINQVELKGGDKESTGALKATIEYGNVNITKPENVKSFIEIMGELAPVLQQSNSSALDSVLGAFNDSTL